MVKCEKCGKDAFVWRKLDDNPRPLCSDCFHELEANNDCSVRHYFRIFVDLSKKPVMREKWEVM